MDKTDERIDHLDFPIEEEEKEPESKHYAHPIDPTIYWCGVITPIELRGQPGCNTGVPVSEITCVDCLHLYIAKGADWWWKVNRAWYNEREEK